MAKLRYLERYFAGEYASVWRELIKLGDRVLHQPLRDECVRVCEEIVRRAYHNLYRIHTRLLELGYEFAEPHEALVDASPNAVAEIEKVEQELGAFPLIAQAWYRKFASVNFCQAEQQWLCASTDSMIRPLPAPDIFGLGSNSVLWFQSLKRSLEEWQQMDAVREEDLRQLKESGMNVEPSESNGSCHFLPLGGSASNCDPKGFELPCFGIDGVIYDDRGDGIGGTYFVDELREAFRWGGFPFWKSIFKNRDFYLPMHYRPNFEKLLPVLKDGLLEL